ncbi:MAG: hypothetical protein AAGF30_16565 [Pseudomonadota bacterium]
MIAGVAKRGAVFACITFALLLGIDGLAAGSITSSMIGRAAAIALIGALVYSLIRFVIAWANE